MVSTAKLLNRACQTRKPKYMAKLAKMRYTARARFFLKSSSIASKFEF